MKSILISCALLLATNISATSQNLIAIQNGGTPVFFQQFDEAISASHDGDTIYLPGGTWNISTPINKRLHIAGVGHNPDSTHATFPTKLIGSFNLVGGASGGSLSGVFLDGSILGSTDTITSYTVDRCYLKNGIGLYSANSNFTFIENVVGGNAHLIDQTVSNCSFFNNIFDCYFGNNNQNVYYDNCFFRNNIFLKGSYCSYGCEWAIAGQYLLLENNVFATYYSNYSCFSRVSNSILKNNLSVETINFSAGTNVGSNNILGQAQLNIFVIQEGSAFSYTDDYHLQPSSPGKGAGQDGTDIGIYGGSYPWKDGSIPANPHFQKVQVPAQTDSLGNLKVKIKVAAQNR